MKSLEWIGSSKKDIKKFPEDIQDSIGFALLEAQKGDKHIHAKSLKRIKATEIVERSRNGTYRVVYTTAVKNVVYVLHAFQKKSKKGIKTPMQEINLVKQRLKEVINLN